MYKSSDLKLSQFVHSAYDSISNKSIKDVLDIKTLDIEENTLLNFFIYMVFSDKKNPIVVKDSYFTFGFGIQFQNECTEFFIETKTFRKFSIYSYTQVPLIENENMYSKLLEVYHKQSRLENFLQYSMIYGELEEFKSTSASVII